MAAKEAGDYGLKLGCPYTTGEKSTTDLEETTRVKCITPHCTSGHLQMLNPVIRLEEISWNHD